MAGIDKIIEDGYSLLKGKWWGIPILVIGLLGVISFSIWNSLPNTVKERLLAPSASPGTASAVAAASSPNMRASGSVAANSPQASAINRTGQVPVLVPATTQSEGAASGPLQTALAANRPDVAGTTVPATAQKTALPPSASNQRSSLPTKTQAKPDPYKLSTESERYIGTWTYDGPAAEVGGKKTRRLQLDKDTGYTVIWHYGTPLVWTVKGNRFFLRHARGAFEEEGVVDGDTIKGTGNAIT